MSNLKLYLAQINQVWEDKKANKEHIQKLLDQETMDPDSILILPEMFNTSFTTNPEGNFEDFETSESIQWLKEISIRHRVAIVTSLIIKEKDQYFNRLVFINGQDIIGQYDKNYLFSLAGENKHFTAGIGKVTVNYNGWRILPLICYDLRFPEHARIECDTDQEYDLLIYVANWPEKRVEHWKNLLEARAIENLTYCVGVNRVGEDGNGFVYNGQSKVVDPTGEVLLNFKDGEEGLKSVQIQLNQVKSVRERFGFLKDIR